MAREPTSDSWFRCSRIVEFRDTDAAGIAHFSAFFFWMESTEHEFLRKLGIRVVDNDPEDMDSLRQELAPEEAGQELEVSWPRVSVSADYKAAVRFGDTLDVFIAVAELGSSSVNRPFLCPHGGGPAALGGAARHGFTGTDGPGLEPAQRGPDHHPVAPRARQRRGELGGQPPVR